MIEVVLLALVIIYLLVTDVVTPLVKGKTAKVGNPVSLKDLGTCLELLKHDVQDLKMRVMSLEKQLQEIELRLSRVE